MTGFTLKAIGEMETVNDGIVKLAGAELGVESFGIQVFDFPAGFPDYPEHDHSSEGMEEVYVVLRGSAEFEIDGERVSLDRDRMLRIGADSRRKLLPGPEGVRILAIGSSPGKPYERPEGLRLPAQSGELTLEIKRVLGAAPSDVFGAFIAPDELAKWWGPEGFSIPSLDFNPRVGDSYRIEMQPPEGDRFNLTGEFREVEASARLAYTFAWEDPDPDDVENLVELTFRDRGESTEVVLTQGPFKTEARRELHRNGWTDSIDKLEQLIAP
jgi:uncharacterized protein YndB with AHSA1/START domain